MGLVRFRNQIYKMISRETSMIMIDIALALEQQRHSYGLARYTGMYLTSSHCVNMSRKQITPVSIQAYCPERRLSSTCIYAYNESRLFSRELFRTF